MRILIEAIGSNEIPELLTTLCQFANPPIHELVDDPRSAELILFCGSWAMEGKIREVTSHPYVQTFRGKCVAYSDDDFYLPLLPGVYCSPEQGFSTRTGRVVSYAYIARHAQKGNPFVRDVNEHRQKDLLFSFQGASTSFLRKRLFRISIERGDALVEDTSAHANWLSTDTTIARQQAFVDTMLRSHFALCPRGAGTGSFRLFEAMRLGVAPVLLSDKYVLPNGPDWDSFLIRIPESQIADLSNILEARRSESLKRGKQARAAWVQWFDRDKEFNRIVGLCQEARESSLRFEAIYRACWPMIIWKHSAGRSIRKNVRTALLRFLKATGLRFPYSLRGQDAKH